MKSVANMRLNPTTAAGVRRPTGKLAACQPGPCGMLGLASAWAALVHGSQYRLLKA